MKSRRHRLACEWMAIVIFLTTQLTAVGGASPNLRSLPKPLPSHPGNIFLAGEEISVAVPATQSPWQLENYAGEEPVSVGAENGQVPLGRLPVGFYRLRQKEGSRWISLGVVAPLQTPTPYESPVAVDVAMAWFYPPANLSGSLNAVCRSNGLVMKTSRNPAKRI